MADLKYYDVIIKPIITEKSMSTLVRRNIHLVFILRQQRIRLRKLLKKCLAVQRLPRLIQLTRMARLADVTAAASL